MTEHTKTPWHNTGLPDKCGYKAINGDTHNVCIIWHDPKTIRTQQANAEFIVKACNSHDALVSALTMIYDDEDIMLTVEQHLIIQKALEQAKGE